MAQGRARPSVLVVDDNPHIHELFSRCLAPRTSRLLHAANPTDAVGILGRERPDLAFLDLSFPGRFKGTEAVKLLRSAARQAQPGLSIFAVSGVYWKLPEIIELYRAGADGFFSKPFDARALVESLALAGEPAQLSKLDGCTCSEAARPPSALILSDDAQAGSALAAGLERQGFVVHQAGHQSVGLIMAHKLSPDAVVLDLELEPDLRSLDALGLLGVLKAGPRTSGAVVAMVAGRPQPGEELRCLEAGASFYYPKRAHDWEAVAVQLRRRLRAHAVEAHDTMSMGRVCVDLRSKRAFVERKDMGLTAMEFDLLACLMRHSPHLVTWEDIQKKVWGWDGRKVSAKEPSTLHVIRNRLRGKMGKAAGCVHLQKGLGLSFWCP